MRILFRVSATVVLVIGIAATYGLFRAPFSWKFRLMLGTTIALGMYFAWLALRLSLVLGLPTTPNHFDASTITDHPLTKRAILVLLGAAGMLVATIVLGVAGFLE